MENLDKLPKWAQTEVIRLEKQVEYLQNRLDQFSGEGKTNTKLVEGLSTKPLPNNSQIEFAVGDNLQNKVCIYVKKDGTIDVHADARDGSRFVFAPRAANAGLFIFVPDTE